MRASASASSFASNGSRRDRYYESGLSGQFRGSKIPTMNQPGSGPPNRRPQSASAGVRLGASASMSSLGSTRYTGTLGRSTSTTIVRAGGRLYAESPVAGFTKEEMLREAKVRQEHNRQRSKLKQLLIAASGPGPAQTVSIDELLLSAKIAKMSLPEELLFKSPYASRYTASRDEGGAPKDIHWRSFYGAIDYPKLASEADRLSRRPRPQSASPVVRGPVAPQAAAQAAAAAAPSGPSDAEIRRAGRILRQHMETKFTQMRSAFRAMDEDCSGTVTRKELRAMILAMNLSMSTDVINALIDLADFDGDGNINYAEFARLMTADDVLSMKDTLRAAGGQHGYTKRGTVQPKPPRPPPGPLPGGATADELRRAQQALRDRITTKYTYLTDAFRNIDEDHSGRLGKSEIRQLCVELNMPLPETVLDGLLLLADHDGDMSISYAEFARLISADDVVHMKGTLQAAP